MKSDTIFLTVSAESFSTKDIKWALDGKGLILLGKDTFCCAFEVEEEAATES